MGSAQDKRVIEIDEGWGIISKGIDKLKSLLDDKLEGKFSGDEWMRLYTTVYDMCTQKPPNDYSAALYGRYRETFNEYLSRTVLSSLDKKMDETMLKELVRRWENHKIMVRWMSRFFGYLDRYYIGRHSYPTLDDVGAMCFRDLVYVHVKSDVKNAIMKLILRERDGEQIDRDLIKRVLEIFVAMGMGNMEVYETDFEEFLLADTAAFYKRKAAVWIQEDSCPEYLVKSEECIDREKTRVSSYLHDSSEGKLLSKVEQELLAEYIDRLIGKEHSGARALLANNKLDDLSRMFRLFSHVPNGLKPIAEIFRKHIEEDGMALVKQAHESVQQRRPEKKDATGSIEMQFVRDAIELHDKYLRFVHGCFDGTMIFHKALKEAFEVFCNKNILSSTSAEMLASFCDNLLKKGSSEKLSDEAMEETLDKVVKLLAFVSDKDLFAEFYRKKLARRLLNDRSANDDYERSILTKLKQQCGAQFTSKMEGMVNDLQLAKENQRSLDDYFRDHADKKPPIDLQVTVLTTGFWPTYPFVELNLPEEMIQGVDVFKQFYETKTQNRKLTWIYSLGTCQVIGKFDARTIELVLSPFQACCLVLFNSADTLTFAEILERLNLPEPDVVRVLHSLSCAKYKVLTKKPENRTITNSDSFTFNSKFTERLKRIKIPLPTIDEKVRVAEDVDKDRRYAIDAAVVRTMKSRKVLQHQQLVLEVVQQLSKMFKPEIKLIKKRIEDLISREYLERDRDSPNTFRYLA